MIILAKYRKWLEKLIGLDRLGGLGSILLQNVYLITFMSFVSNEMAYFILNIHGGIDRAMSVVPGFFGVLPNMLIYIFLLINRKRYYGLLDEMQDLVNESTENLKPDNVVVKNNPICWLK